MTACRLPDRRVPRGAVQGAARPRRQGVHAQEDDGTPLRPRRVYLRQETPRHRHLDHSPGVQAVIM